MRNWPNGWKRPVIRHGKPTKWDWIVLHPRDLFLGKRVDIGAFTLINAEAGVSIEDDVQIGPHCAILSKDTIGRDSGSIQILKNACVGSHCTLLPNSVVGERATLGAHSLLKGEVPEGETWAGVPAKRIK